MDNERLNIRVNQIEEQLSNTSKAIDKLTADIDALKDYAVENNKVVNGILRKLDDQGERMDKVLLRMEKEEKNRKSELEHERKQRQQELDAQNERFMNALNEDRKLRREEITIMNRRLELLESKA
jgi:chromosome segregation ATPase